MTSRIEATGVGKKFCRSLAKSMVYGLSDATRDILGLPARRAELRPGEFWVAQDMSFNVAAGECLAVIGPNGAGKSTLLKMLAGIVLPDEGSITVRGRVGSLLEVGAGFHPMLTGRENVFVNAAILGMKRRAIAQQFDRIVEFAGLEEFVDTPLKYYSSGMRVRLGFSIAAHAEPDVFLIDEALAVGDAEFRIRCLNRIAQLREQGTSIVFVSHSEMQVREAADRCLLIGADGPRLFDKVDDAFREYHQLLAAAGAGEVERVHFGDRVQISHVQIAGREQDAALQTGGHASIRVCYESEHDVPGARLLLRLWTQQGQLATVFDSADDGSAIGLAAGGGEITVGIPEFCLAPGNYRLAGGIRHGAATLCWSTHLARLTVSGGSNGAGGEAEGIAVMRREISHDAVTCGYARRDSAC